MVRDGKLHLNWTYSGEIHCEAQVAELLDRFVEQLTSLIDHCAASAYGATPSDFPLAGLTQAQLDALRLDMANVEDIYPLSPLQQGMLYHSLYDTHENTYLNQMRVDIDGLNPKRFKVAWETVAARHDILRTGFLSQGERPLQWVARQVDLIWLEEELARARKSCSGARCLGSGAAQFFESRRASTDALRSGAHERNAIPLHLDPPPSTIGWLEYFTIDRRSAAPLCRGNLALADRPLSRLHRLAANP